MKKVVLENLKDIKSMEFELPQENDVYLLVGKNGSGKSTLLVCLHRICNSYAFSDNFKVSRIASIDQYKGASIKFIVDDLAIVYRKYRARWSASPRSNVQKVLKSFGFSESIFLKADSRRIEAKQADIEEGYFVDVDNNIKNTLNVIFETKKYDKLRHLCIGNGKGRPLTYFYTIDNGDEQYSEKRFSSGELAIVKLVARLSKTSDNALVLLDEAEMALHPKIQINLLNYLKEQSEEKNLTIIIATHSPTLINNTNREKIILLEPKADETLVHDKCYPARAIGAIDHMLHSGFDYLFFVEDGMAKRVLNEMIKIYLEMKPEHSKAIRAIIPVGGYRETAKLAESTKKQIFHKVKVFAVLDTDAFEEKNGVKESDIVKDLGIIPEVYLIKELETNREIFAEEIRNKYHCEVEGLISSNNYNKCKSPNPSTVVKHKFKVLVEYLAGASGKHEETVTDKIIEMVIEHMDKNVILKLLNPIFKYGN